jgi:hypothetical protein
MGPIPVFFRCVGLPRGYLQPVCSSGCPHSGHYCSTVSQSGPVNGVQVSCCVQILRRIGAKMAG